MACDLQKREAVWMSAKQLQVQAGRNIIKFVSSFSFQRLNVFTYTVKHGGRQPPSPFGLISPP